MHPETLKIHQIPIYLDTRVFWATDPLKLIAAQMHTKIDIFPIDMHKHNFYEINVVYKGSGYHYIENKCFEAKTGSVFIIPPGLFHGYYTEDEDTFQILNIFIKTEFIDKYKKELASIPGYSMLFEIEPYIRKEVQSEFFLILSQTQFEEMKDYFEELQKNNSIEKNQHALLIGLTFIIISKLSSFLLENHQNIMDKAISLRSIEQTFILKTIEYINRSFYEKISIDDLAQMANMSRSTYIRHFKKLTKKTPNEYLTDIRIKEACIRLKESNSSIADISNECGFFDPSHFSKTFLKFKGITPLKYRGSL